MVSPNHKKEKRRDSPPPPVPPAHDRPSTSGRPRSSTLHPSTAQVTPLSKGKLKSNRDEASPDWVMPSSRQTKENGSTQVRSPFPRLV